MYPVGDDIIVRMDGLPGISPGAPLPMVFATETSVLLSYIVDRRTAAMTTHKKPSEIGATTIFAALRFDALCHMFGYPNEEVSHGHPLASRGYHAFDIFEVKQSSWIRQLECMNRVHRRHMPALFENLRHFIFGFRDSTFEVLAENFEADLIDDNSARSKLIAWWESRQIR